MQRFLEVIPFEQLNSAQPAVGACVPADSSICKHLECHAEYNSSMAALCYTSSNQSLFKDAYSMAYSLLLPMALRAGFPTWRPITWDRGKDDRASVAKVGVRWRYT